MATIDTFSPAFKTHRKRPVSSQRLPAMTKHCALNEGERLGRTAEGVAVIHVTADDETGEVSSLDVLARHDAIRMSSKSRSARCNRCRGQPRPHDAQMQSRRPCNSLD